MDTEHLHLLQVIRGFNRFYTNILGLVDLHLLGTDFSLSEARVLFEIGNHKNCTAKELTEKLKMDGGYLSRILKGFERKGFIYRSQSEADGRKYFLSLTREGREALAKLDSLSNRQINKMIGDLPPFKQQIIAKCMTTIEKYLSGESGSTITIRQELRPGDAGTLIHLHGSLYARECGYNYVFEAYVCNTFFEFLKNYDPGKDRIWFAEDGGQMIGAVAIVGHGEEIAQLRWFLIHPDYRGCGIGRRLLREALQFCKNQKYQKVFLETTDDQKTAIQMYRNAGFKKVEEKEDCSWGLRHMEQTYELYL